MICEEEIDNSSEEISLTPQEKAVIAKMYIDAYFKDKQVGDHVNLSDSRYTDLLWNTNICDAVDVAYGAIEKSGRFNTKSSEHSISEDIRLVIKILGKIKHHVPQELSAGMLLMHLEILEGIQF